MNSSAFEYILGWDMAKQQLCDETAQPWFQQEPHNISGGLKSLPGRMLITAFRLEKAGKRMRRTGVTKVNVTVTLRTTGAIYVRFNLLYGGRHIQNPWHFVKTLPDCTSETVARLASEWMDQKYDVTCQDSKRIRAALVMQALKDQT